MSIVQSGTILYHWYYGPLLVTQVKNGYIYLSILHPEHGIPDGSSRLTQGNNYKFQLDSMGTWLFTQPDQIEKSPAYDRSLQHKYFFSSQIRLSLCKEEIALLNNLIDENDQPLKPIRKIITNIENFEIGKEQKVNERTRLEEEILVLSMEVNKLLKYPPISPREHKEKVNKMKLLKEKMDPIQQVVMDLSKVIQEIQVNIQKEKDDYKKLEATILENEETIKDVIEKRERLTHTLQEKLKEVAFLEKK